jgi:hypothetical protein
MSAVRVTKVEPEAALELLDLIQRQMTRMIQEHQPEATTQPNVAYQLAGALERFLKELCGDRPIRWQSLDAEAVAHVRWSVHIGRRLDMTEAFNRLNPTFGVRAEHGCWNATAEQRERQAAMHRRELELSMGQRFARMLTPACQGGEAA